MKYPKCDYSVAYRIVSNPVPNVRYEWYNYCPECRYEWGHDGWSNGMTDIERFLRNLVQRFNQEEQEQE